MIAQSVVTDLFSLQLPNYGNRVDWQGTLRIFIGKVNGCQTNSHLIFTLNTNNKNK